MASNPMQRQKNISFMKGVIITLLICAIIIGLLGFALYKKIEAERELKQSMVQVYTLKTDVSSGQVITQDMIEILTVSKSTVPSNAISDATTFGTYSLQDEKGNEIYTDKDGLYILENNKKVKLQKDENNNYTKTVNGNTEIVEIKEVALIAKVNMKANTVITRELVTQSDEVNTKDVRVQEYNMITLPATLETGDFVDIRLRMPNGLDYIVVSKKEVTIPDVAGVPSTDTINVNMSEEEILVMSNAIVEAYIMGGSELYATKYTDPGNQEKSSITYPVSSDVSELIEKNENIVQTARDALFAKYNRQESNDQRYKIEGQLQNSSVEATDNVEAGIQEQIQKQKELREKYLETLNSAEF